MTRSDNTRLAGRVSGPSRSPILTSLTLVVCMAVVVALLSGITTPLPKASLQGKVHLTSAGAASYQPAELWDGGSPDRALHRLHGVWSGGGGHRPEHQVQSAG